MSPGFPYSPNSSIIHITDVPDMCIKWTDMSPAVRDRRGHGCDCFRLYGVYYEVSVCVSWYKGHRRDAQ